MYGREWKTFRDAVHGEIKVHPLCIAIIDTIEFQRLRNISQCGLTHLVYPSAHHTRFEHSLGVYYLAGVMLKALESPNNIIDDIDKLCVQIAALCHDLGHGPFSHTWEQFLHESGEKFKHEDMSVNLFYELIKKNNLYNTFDTYGIGPEKRTFIGNLINGKPIHPKEKGYLFEVVANNQTGVDVDKWDYILRDAFHFGIKTDLNYERILSSTFVVTREGGDTHIGFRDKVAKNILDIFKIREKLHVISYQHRVTKVIEIMLLNALLCFDKFYKIKLTNGTEVKLSQCHYNLDAYIKLSDALYYELHNSIDENLKEGRDILESLMTRKLYVHSLYSAFTENWTDSLHVIILNSIKEEINKSEISKSISLDKIEVYFIDDHTRYELLKNIHLYNRNMEKVEFPCDDYVPKKKDALLVYTEIIKDDNRRMEIKKELEKIFKRVCSLSDGKR